MRETKDQTINRLKQKVAELTIQLKEEKRDNKLSRKENKCDIMEIGKNYKSEIANLQKEIQLLHNKFDEERRVWEDELEKTKQLLVFWKNKSKTYETGEDHLAKKRRMEISAKDIKRENDVRLEYFQMGVCCDKYQFHFFDTETLTININPHTGGRLNYLGTGKLINLIQNNPYYTQRLNEIRQCLKENDFNTDFEIQQKVYSVGMDIYKTLYLDFPFEKYEI